MTGKRKRPTKQNFSAAPPVRDHHAAALAHPLFKPRTVKNKKREAKRGHEKHKGRALD